MNNRTMLFERNQDTSANLPPHIEANIFLKNILRFELFFSFNETNSQT